MVSQEFDQRVTEALEEVEIVIGTSGINAITDTKVGQELLADFGNAVALSFLQHVSQGIDPRAATDHAIRETAGHVITLIFDMGRVFQSHGWLPETKSQ
jgi:hypothetical protein